jgi:Uma2 family endonuclease
VTAVPSPRLMTADDLLALTDTGRRYELVRGELIDGSPSAFGPSAIVGRIMAILGPFVLQNRLGEIGSAEGGFQLDREPDTVRAPDVWCVRADRLPAEQAATTYFQGAPDLAIEVLSPSDRFVDVMAKVRDYLAAGCPLVWVLDPIGRSAAVFGAGNVAILLGEDGVLDGGAALPGFSLPLPNIFSRP